MAKAKAKSMAADVTELLHQDHQKVQELFFQFSKAEENKEKEALVKEILTELHIHATIEEEIVYPGIEEEVEEGDELVGEAETEHKVVKFLMAELSHMTAANPKFDANVTVLCELVVHHLREEEKEMFKKLRESGADLEELAEQVLERKAQLKKQPLPEMTASLTVGKKKEVAEKVSKPQGRKSATSKARGRKSA